MGRAGRVFPEGEGSGCVLKQQGGFARSSGVGRGRRLVQRRVGRLDEGIRAGRKQQTPSLLCLYIDNDKSQGRDELKGFGWGAVNCGTGTGRCVCVCVGGAISGGWGYFSRLPDPFWQNKKVWLFLVQGGHPSLGTFHELLFSRKWESENPSCVCWVANAFKAKYSICQFYIIWGVYTHCQFIPA